MDDQKDDNLEASFPLFNYQAMQKLPKQGSSNSLLNQNTFTSFPPEGFRKKVIIEKVAPAEPKKRGRKPKPVNAKDIDDPNITIREIIDNYNSGVPAESEQKKKVERLKLMNDKKSEKKSLQAPSLASIQSSAEKSDNSTIQPTSETKVSLFDNEEVNKFAPKLIMKNGKLTVEEPAIEENDPENQQLVVVHSGKAKKLTSATYRKKEGGYTKKWTPEETRKFFKTIEIFGSDCSMIAKLFPNRDDKQIKNKFRKEEKDNAEQMDQAFKKHKLSGKRTFKNQLKHFQLALERGDSGDIKVPEDLSRTISNSSVDSMDKTIMNQLQGIFNEINPNKKSNKHALPASQIQIQETIEPQPRQIEKETPTKNQGNKSLLLNI